MNIENLIVDATNPEQVAKAQELGARIAELKTGLAKIDSGIAAAEQAQREGSGLAEQRATIAAACFIGEQPSSTLSQFDKAHTKRRQELADVAAMSEPLQAKKNALETDLTALQAERRELAARTLTDASETIARKYASVISTVGEMASVLRYMSFAVEANGYCGHYSPSINLPKFPKFSLRGCEAEVEAANAMIRGNANSEQISGQVRAVLSGLGLA